MVDIDVNKIWRQCLSVVRDNVSAEQYATWIEPIVPMKYDDGTFTIGVPSPYFFEHLEEHYAELLLSVLKRVAGMEIQLVYEVLTDRVNNISVTLPAQSSEIKTEDKFQSNLISNYVFDNFLKGRSNEYAVAVAEAVAENPARTSFNPLFYYGASGVGKTHLVNAIGARIKARHPEKKVLYISAHLFQVQYTNSVRSNHFNDFMGFYQLVDVLIIDDVQEFAGAQKTQNTFFHIFNHLHQNGKQLILTADRPPKDLEGLEDRLLTRFRWGLVAKIDKPDSTLRKEILQRKIYQNGLAIPVNVVDFIAEHVTDSVRELEGVVNSLLAQSILLKREVNLELVMSVVSSSVNTNKSEITIEDIINKVCGYYGVEQALIQTKSRKKEVVCVRQMAMYLAKKHTDMSTTRIGLLIGNRDHATVLHAYKSITDTMSVDRNMQRVVDDIERLLVNA